MIHIFRKHQQWLMILITFFVIISFVWFYNRTNLSERGQPDVIAQVYDRKITRHDAERLSRKIGLARQLFMIDLLQGIMGLEAQHAVENLIVLRHEADIIGIQPTDEQVVATVKAIPYFQTNGAFDSQKYALFLNDALPPMGFTETDLEDIVRDQLRLQKLKGITDATAIVHPAEVREEYMLDNQKVQLSVIRFNRADFAATVQVSDDDVKKRFEQQKDSLKSEEKRRIKFVEFTMNETEKKLAGKERTPVLEKLKTQAEQFAQEMTVKDAKFDDVAKKLGAIIHETQLFPRSAPDPQLAREPMVITEAFRRTKEDPNSDPLPAGRDGFAVLQLVETVPSKLLTLEESKPQLVEQIKNERAQELMTMKAAEVRKKIAPELKAGKSLADAATAAGVKAESIAPFSQNEPNKDVADAMDLLARALYQTEGQLGEFVPGEDGGVLILVEKRLPIDEAKFGKEKPKLEERLIGQRRAITFQEWLRARRVAAKFQFNPTAG